MEGRLDSTREPRGDKSADAALRFRFGYLSSLAPLGFLVSWAITICLMGAPDTKGLILGAVLGLMLGMFLVKDDWADYAEQIFNGMADRVGVVAIVAWFWAGMFAQVLQVGGLVKGLAWIGAQAGLTGGLFVAATFLLAATFATAVGTGYGTTVAFCTLLYPAGVLLGSDPVVLFAAVLSGAAFGDNMAPVSDTTIVSATTQMTDVPGVVRSRVKYALAAACPSLVLFALLGGGEEPVDRARAELLLSSNTDPSGLILLLPFAIVIILALRGHHLVTSLTWGILVAVGTVLFRDLAAPDQLFWLDANRSQVGGALVDGIAGYLEFSVLILLILAAGHILQAGGAMVRIADRLKSFAGRSVARAEVGNWGIVLLFNAFITANTAAEIAAAPFVRDLGKSFKLHPYRRANYLDAMSSALGYIFPWSGGVLIGYQTIRNLAADLDFVRIVSPTEVWPWVFHGWLLTGIMLMAAITGFGRRYEGPDGEELLEAPDSSS